MPFDQRCGNTLGQGQGGGGLRQRQSPQRIGIAALGKPGVLLLAQAVPQGRGLVVGQALAAQFLAGGLHGGLGTAQAQPQLALRPAAGVQRQGLAAPAVQCLQGLRFVHGKDQGGLRRGHGQHF